MRANGRAVDSVEALANGKAALQPLLLSAADLAQLLRLSTATIWRLRASGKLPRPLDALGRQLIRWDAGEVRRWIMAKMPPPAEWEAIEGTRNANGRPR